MIMVPMTNIYDSKKDSFYKEEIEEIKDCIFYFVQTVCASLHKKFN